MARHMPASKLPELTGNSMSLMLTALKDVPLIRHGDDLADIILKGTGASGLTIEDNDIFVIAQKIVSKAEGRMMDLATIEPSKSAVELALITEKDARVVELM